MKNIINILLLFILITSESQGNENLNNKKEIYKFLSEKYGDWILLNPPFKKNSYLLWFLPYLLFILGIILLFFLLKKPKIRLKE